MACGARSHGTKSAYNRGCRCPEAREAWRLYNKRRRENRQLPAYVDSTGSRRRIRALMAIGWSLRFIHQTLGYAKNNGDLARRPAIRAEKAKRIADLYDLLSMTPGPSKRSRTWAQKAGYCPPLAWDDDTIDDPNAGPNVGITVEVDEVAVWRASMGDRPEALRRKELWAAVWRCHQKGLSDAEIGERLGLSAGAVQQIRRRHDAPAPEVTGQSGVSDRARIPTQRPAEGQVRESA